MFAVEPDPGVPTNLPHHMLSAMDSKVPGDQNNIHSKRLAARM